MCEIAPRSSWGGMSFIRLMWDAKAGKLLPRSGGATGNKVGGSGYDKSLFGWMIDFVWQIYDFFSEMARLLSKFLYG